LKVKLWDVTEVEICDAKDDSSIRILGSCLVMESRRRLSKRRRNFQKGIDDLLKGSSSSG
jgi:hypothetical protein